VSARNRIMLDVAGTTLDEHDCRRLLHPSTGAVILFARNFTSHAQVAALCASIRELRADLLIAVDHEGGRVQRFKGPGFTTLPAMASIGAVWSKGTDDARHAARLAHAAGYIMARELRGCGIDFSFAPVLDLDFGHSAVIGTRAFHRERDVVHDLSRALIQGMRQGGMANCGKHFPGHGYASADSHVAVPVDDRPLEAIMADDAKPYQWLGNALLAVMPAHVIYPAVDALPAGFSAIWLQQVLRSKLGFCGAILSDDLAMQGAHVVGDVVARGEAARAAGCDMVLICNSPDDADLLLAGLSWPDDHLSMARLGALRGFEAPGSSQSDAVLDDCRALMGSLS
jgi:beta-N-acetylhexosaminidase